MDGVEQMAHAADAAGLVGDEIAATADQEAQFGDGLVLEGDGAEVGGAQAELVGDDAGVLGIALGLAADAALAGAVDGQPRDTDEALAGGQQHGAEQGGDAPEQVMPTSRWPPRAARSVAPLPVSSAVLRTFRLSRTRPSAVTQWTSLAASMPTLICMISSVRLLLRCCAPCRPATPYYYYVIKCLCDSTLLSYAWSFSRKEAVGGSPIPSFSRPLA